MTMADQAMAGVDTLLRQLLSLCKVCLEMPLRGGGVCQSFLSLAYQV